MKYSEVEKAVYDSLCDSAVSDEKYFSLRIQSHKKDPNGLFIGTENSGYFKFTFWSIPINFKGSSGNFLDLVVFKRKGSWSFKFEGSIPRDVEGEQNELSLKFLDENINDLLLAFDGYKTKQTDKKTRSFSINAIQSYQDIESLTRDFKAFIDLVIDSVDDRMIAFKATNENWKASRLDLDQWDEMHDLYERRLARNSSDVKEKTTTEKDMANKVQFGRNDQPINQILYGPPGTGKTYETATIALDILGVKYDRRDREATMVLYRQEVEKGNIDFTTFHQSMSYEDFIEGIKPVMIDSTTSNQGTEDDDTRDVAYTISPGVLMKMAALATYENYITHQSASTPVNFDYLYDQYIESLREKIEEGKPHEIHTYQGLPLIIDRINRNDSVITLYQGSSRVSRSRPKRREHLRVLYAKIRDINEIKNVKDIGPLIGTRGGMSGYWAVFKDFLEFSKEIDQSAVDADEVAPDLDDIIRDYKSGLYNEAPFEDGGPKKVLIIDEINRGNVSAIFGELITLLEKDKRIGEVNQISAALPYTNNATFSLPPNLYIIGTMNTADRSVEALDSALRRRFTFKEKMPQPSVLMGQDPMKYKTAFYGYGLDNILTTINHRIEVLIDRDHTIGHSYFFGLQSDGDLLEVFTDKIIPLLQEYFYNDYGKMQLVLGKGFIAKKPQDKVTFATNDVDDPSMYVDTDKQIYSIANVNVGTLQSALDSLMGKSGVGA